MSRVYDIIAVAAALTLAACAGAEEGVRPANLTTGELFSRLESRPDFLQTVGFSFRQTATVQGQVIESEGECSLAEGGKVRMLTRMPTPIGEVTSLLVSDGDVMWHEVSANSAFQIVRYDLSGIEASVEANLTGLGIWGTLERERFPEMLAEMTAGYDIAVTGIEGSGASAVYSIEGRPKREEDGGLEVNIGKEDYFLRSLTAFDGNGVASNRLTVENFRSDIDVSLSQFRYTPPAGVPVEDGNAMIRALSRGPRRHQMEQTEAPDFTLASLEGEPVNLNALRGKTVVLDFWATWCGPCLQQMPHLQRIHERFANDGVVVLGVNTEDRSKAQRYIDKTDYTFTVLVDDGKVSRQYQVRGLPTTVIVNSDGVVDHYLFGAHSEQQLRAALAQSGVPSN